MSEWPTPEDLCNLSDEWDIPAAVDQALNYAARHIRDRDATIASLRAELARVTAERDEADMRIERLKGALNRAELRELAALADLDEANAKATLAEQRLAEMERYVSERTEESL